MTTNEQEAKRWNDAGAKGVTPESVAASRKKADEMLDYDVTVRREGFGQYAVTAHSENARKLLGVGTFSYEQAEWKKLNKDLRNYTYRIEVL